MNKPNNTTELLHYQVEFPILSKNVTLDTECHRVSFSKEFWLTCLKMRQINLPDLSQNEKGKFA